MRPIVTNRVVWSVGRWTEHTNVKHTVASPAKTAEPIEVPFGMWTRVGPRNHILDNGAHWRYLANTIEPSVAMRPFCQITLITCYALQTVTEFCTLFVIISSFFYLLYLFHVCHYKVMHMHCL